MDPLTQRGAATALTAGLVVALAACVPGDRSASAPDDDPASSASSSSDAVDDAEELSVPEPVRPDETVLGSRSGSGPARAALTGATRDLVYVYGACTGDGEVAARLVARVPSEVVVPCDGVVSRMQVYTEPRQDFRVAVDAAPGQRWVLLVTARDEPGSD